jgi:phosphoglycolate phosphatase
MASPDPIAAVLFDLDGTLVDSAPRIAVALNEALVANALPTLPAGRIAGMIGGGPRALIDRALRALSADSRRADEVLGAYRERYLALDAPPWTLYPGVIAMLDSLGGIRIRRGIVTNTSAVFAEAILDHCNIASRIETTVSGDAGLPLKPDPAPLLHACELLEVAPVQVLVVGDSATDVHAARSAGMRVVCMSYGYSHGQSVADLDCDAVLDDIAELPRWIASVNAGA